MVENGDDIFYWFSKEFATFWRKEVTEIYWLTYVRFNGFVGKQ